MKILRTLEPTMMPGNPEGPPEAQQPVIWNLRALVEISGKQYVGIFSRCNGNVTPRPEDLRQLVEAEPADSKQSPITVESASGAHEQQPALTV